MPPGRPELAPNALLVPLADVVCAQPEEDGDLSAATVSPPPAVAWGRYVPIKDTYTVTTLRFHDPRPSNHTQQLPTETGAR
ncbi:hypothetical protein C8R46DRAFT_1344239 [Mycena filopes]|nr:hypothetical protein C8R46DRAFT_1344239 [Mycena filopes]